MLYEVFLVSSYFIWNYFRLTTALAACSYNCFSRKSFRFWSRNLILSFVFSLAICICLFRSWKASYLAASVSDFFKAADLSVSGSSTTSSNALPYFLNLVMPVLVYFFSCCFSNSRMVGKPPLFNSLVKLLKSFLPWGIGSPYFEEAYG